MLKSSAQRWWICWKKKPKKSFLQPRASQASTAATVNFWEVFGKAWVDLFASEDNSHCPIFFTKSTDALAHEWPSLPLYAFPPIALLPQVLRWVREQWLKLILIAPLWRNQPWVSELFQLLEAAPWPIPFETGHPLSSEQHAMASTARVMAPACVAAQLEPFDLPEHVLSMMADARAPSTRRLYALKWSVFSAWCQNRNLDPVTSDVSVVLSFLQEILDKQHASSTIKVYAAAIAAFHTPIAGRLVGRNSAVVQFLRAARRINPPGPCTVQPWDYNHQPCLPTPRFILKPRLGYVPKVLSTQFRAHVIAPSALSPSTGSQELSLLCPVRALRVYIEHFASYRKSEKLFVDFGNRNTVSPVSKQNISMWLVDAITLICYSLGLQCPIGVRAHSTIASSWALFSRVSISEICEAAGWSLPSTPA